MQGGDVGVQFSGWLAEFLAARLVVVARWLSLRSRAGCESSDRRPSVTDDPNLM